MAKLHVVFTETAEIVNDVQAETTLRESLNQWLTSHYITTRSYCLSSEIKVDIWKEIVESYQSYQK